ncbi:MAG TPA: hypothetical protein VFQ45_14010, partial [Longimicrobium sp.]|nr:hypothetical protein [Longimicrobium sp.]
MPAAAGVPRPRWSTLVPALLVALAIAACGGQGPVRPEPGCPPECPEPLVGDWSSAAPLPAPRRELPAAVLG